jgi:hypothetical protein
LGEFVDLAKREFEILVTGIGVFSFHCGLADAVINASRRAPRVVMYHACQDYENDLIRGRSINTTPAHLTARFDSLKTHYCVVPLAALTDGTLPD